MRLAHDFFKPQPVKNASVFLLRKILHDGSDEYAIKILQQLRAAATPETQLLIVDNTTAYACADTTPIHNIPGAVADAPPPPLLANKGEANIFPYLGDLTVCAILCLSCTAVRC